MPKVSGRVQVFPINTKHGKWSGGVEFYGAQKVYIISLHTSDVKFTNDMDFWTFSFTFVCFVIVRLSVSNLVIVFNFTT